MLGETFAALRADVAEMVSGSPHSAQATASACAVGLALLVAVWLRLDMPWWAGISAFVAIQATQPASVARGILRIVGTVAGAAVGLLLSPWVIYDHVACVLVLFAIATTGTLGGLVARHSYVWLLGGVTASMVITGSLVDPADALNIAFFRAAEVSLGVAVALGVATFLLPSKSAVAPAPGPGWNGLLDAQWPVTLHAVRTGLAVAIVPFAWTAFNLPGLSQIVVTTAVVMSVPSSAAGSAMHREAIEKRAAHRLLGCLLGGGAGLLLLGLSLSQLIPWLFFLTAGVWVGAHIHFSTRGANYVGTQAVVAFIVTLAQDFGPPQSVLPGVDRFAAMLGGLGILWVLSLIFWPADPVVTEVPP
jgi:uncharacterized membrane protein YccC